MNEAFHDEPPLDIAGIASVDWIDQVHDLSEAGSTNDAALARAAQSPAGKTEVFVTDRQSAGRGRGANQWWSPPGALAFSVLARELGVPMQRIAQASLAVGVAICDALEEFLPVPISLKWPNDVYAEGRKLCGVLIETPGGSPRRLVIGVGINVNNSASGAPEEIRDRAIGMVDLFAKPPHEGPAERFCRTAVLAASLRAIGERVAMLEADDPRLPGLWRERSMLTGRRVRLELPSREVVGVVDSIADDGALLIESEAGIEPCYGGVVAEW